MQTHNTYDDDAALHPGCYLQTVWEDSEMSFKDFASRTKIDPELLNDIMNGMADITPSIAKKLSKASGTTKEYWLGLQAEYDSQFPSEDE